MRSGWERETNVLRIAIRPHVVGTLRPRFRIARSGDESWDYLCSLLLSVLHSSQLQTVLECFLPGFWKSLAYE